VTPRYGADLILSSAMGRLLPPTRKRAVSLETSDPPGGISQDPWAVFDPGAGIDRGPLSGPWPSKPSQIVKVLLLAGPSFFPTGLPPQAGAGFCLRV